MLTEKSPNVHVIIIYMKYFTENGLRLAEWSIDMTLHDANIMLGNIYIQISLTSRPHLAQILDFCNYLPILGQLPGDRLTWRNKEQI